MQELDCVNKIKNSKGTTVTYVMLDSEGNILNLTRNQVKTILTKQQVKIFNLRLSSDNKIIFSNKHDENIIEKAFYRFNAKRKLLGLDLEETFIKSSTSFLAPLFMIHGHIRYPNILRCSTTPDSWEIKYGEHSYAHSHPQYSVYVTSMNKLFEGGRYLEIDLGEEFCTSNVTDMSYMFHNCLNLKSIELHNFDTCKVTDMHGMFMGCKELETIDLKKFNTANVNDMSEMFSLCENINNLDFSSFCTDNVRTMVDMFFACGNIESLNLDSFKTYNLKNMTAMFEMCYKLEKLYMNNFSSKSLELNHRTFLSCTQLKELQIPKNFKFLEPESMFRFCKSEKEFKERFS